MRIPLNRTCFTVLAAAMWCMGLPVAFHFADTMTWGEIANDPSGAVFVLAGGYFIMWITVSPWYIMMLSWMWKQNPSTTSLTHWEPHHPGISWLVTIVFAIAVMSKFTLAWFFLRYPEALPNVIFDTVWGLTLIWFRAFALRGLGSWLSARRETRLARVG